MNPIIKNLLEHLLKCPNPRVMVATPYISVEEHTRGLIGEAMEKIQMPVTWRRHPQARVWDCFIEGRDEAILSTRVVRPGQADRCVQGVRFSGYLVVDPGDAYRQYDMDMFRIQLRRPGVAREQHFQARTSDL